MNANEYLEDKYNPEDKIKLYGKPIEEFTKEALIGQISVMIDREKKYLEELRNNIGSLIWTISEK